jgi:hypothetical protein
MVNAGFLVAAGRLSWLALGVVSLLGCEPTFDDRNSQILDRRVLGVQALPAQAKPGAEVKLRALVVEPSGTLKNVSLSR